MILKYILVGFLIAAGLAGGLFLFAFNQPGVVDCGSDQACFTSRANDCLSTVFMTENNGDKSRLEILGKENLGAG